MSLARINFKSDSSIKVVPRSSNRNEMLQNALYSDLSSEKDLISLKHSNLRNYAQLHRLSYTPDFKKPHSVINKAKAPMGFEPLTASLLFQRAVYIKVRKRHKLKNYYILILENCSTTPMFIALTLEL